MSDRLMVDDSIFVSTKRDLGETKVALESVRSAMSSLLEMGSVGVEPLFPDDRSTDPTNNLTSRWDGQELRLLNVATLAFLNHGLNPVQLSDANVSLKNEDQLITIQMVDGERPDKGWFMRTGQDLTSQ